jgi:hypothetical protein
MRCFVLALGIHVGLSVSLSVWLQPHTHIRHSEHSLLLFTVDRYDFDRIVSLPDNQQHLIFLEGLDLDGKDRDKRPD